MRRGFICSWVFNDGVGQIHVCDPLPEVYQGFAWADCCPELRQVLARPEYANINSDGACPGIGNIQVTIGPNGRVCTA
jgi:hypothetical protein